jgi:hypothetical protein
LNQKQHSCKKAIKGKILPIDRKYVAGIGVMGIILIGIIAMGCMSTVAGTNPGVMSSRPDPETGIVNWMSAVNGKNLPKLYELSPGFIKKNVTEQEFIASNDGNIILEPGFKFSGYEIMNKTVQGNYANIRAVLIASNSSLTTNATTGVPIFYNFIFSYENNEWKVWTIQF